MVRVDHPFHLAKFEDGKIRIGIDCLRVEDISRKRYRGRNIRDQQIDAKSGERRAIFRGGHPWIAGAFLGHFLSLSLLKMKNAVRLGRGRLQSSDLNGI